MRSNAPVVTSMSLAGYRFLAANTGVQLISATDKPIKLCLHTFDPVGFAFLPMRFLLRSGLGFTESFGFLLPEGCNTGDFVTGLLE